MPRRQFSSMLLRRRNGLLWNITCGVSRAHRRTLCAQRENRAYRGEPHSGENDFSACSPGTRPYAKTTEDPRDIMLSSHQNTPLKPVSPTTHPTPSLREIADCYARVFRHLAYSPRKTGEPFWEELKAPAVLSPSVVTAPLYSGPATTGNLARDKKAL